MISVVLYVGFLVSLGRVKLLYYLENSLRSGLLYIATEISQGKKDLRIVWPRFP